MTTITDEFRVYPLPDRTGHHNLVQLNPDGAEERVANHRLFSVASDAYLSALQAQVDGLTRGGKIRATIRDVDSPGPTVFDGEIEVLGEESVYIDYCRIEALPDELQPLVAGLTERAAPETAVFDERIQEDGPGVYVEVYPLGGQYAGRWLDILIGKFPLEDRLSSLPCINEPAQDVLVQIPYHGQAFTIYYFSAASSQEMAEYRSLVDTPRGSTRELTSFFEDDHDIRSY
ncbi:hypothetical protein [Halosimplex pelagicum]|uniref:Uncharacterized protein n=1 Tax=Halosimplex pelagicum TaxID=869886 RepID=A0A7D5PGV2_9EURY|nr:hypothetical protein [Halosimplex pelagicum]QLH84820.1 hypothetical protein HZS54_25740 [Halosimplex pelagicum]